MYQRADIHFAITKAYTFYAASCSTLVGFLREFCIVVALCSTPGRAVRRRPYRRAVSRNHMDMQHRFLALTAN